MDLIIKVLKVIAILFQVKLGFAILGIITTFLPHGLVWLVGVIVIIGLAIEFWKENKKLWPVVWKLFIFWALFFILQFIVGAIYVGLDILV